MPRLLDDLELVSHGCLVPDSDEHIWEATSAWISGGLRAGERVLYFEDETADRLLNRLEDDRVPVDRATAEGQFTLIPTEATRTTVTVPLDQVEAVMRQAIRETEQQGWPGLRFIGEAAPARLGMGLDMLVGYETIIDRIIRENPHVRLLCLYPREVFDDEAVAAMRRIHPAEVAITPVYDDGLLRITETEQGTLRLAGEVDYTNRLVLRHLLDRALEDMLRSVSRPDDVTLDVSSLRFLDVTGTMDMLHTARQFPRGHRLVLRGVRPQVRRMFQRGGQHWPDRLVLPDRWREPARGGVS